METFSALLAICAGNSPVTGEFPAQRPMTRSFDVSNIFGNQFQTMRVSFARTDHKMIDKNMYTVIIITVKPVI